MEKEKSKNKSGIIIFLIIISVVIISIVISYNTNQLIQTINYQIEQDHKDVTEPYTVSDNMIGYGDDGISNTPISATIQHGILKIEGRITNETGKKLKVKDFAVINFGGYAFAADLNFEGDGTLANKESLNITYETNISAFKHINVIPTTVYVELGTYDSNNNYYEFDIKYVMSWIVY